MNIRRMILLNVILLVIVVGGVYFGWNYYYQSSNFITTSNAFVEAPQVAINPQYAGELTSWNVENGTVVQAGQVLGKESTSVEMQQLGAAAKDAAIVKSVNSAAQLVSPMNGTIVQSQGVSGQMVAPSQSLATVVDLSNLYIVANIRETDIRNVDVGDSVDVTVDAASSLTLKGTVESIGLTTNSVFSLIPPTDLASGNYSKVVQTIPVKISITGYQGSDLRPGFSATVKIHRKSN